MPTLLRNQGNKIIEPTNEVSTYKLNEKDKSFNLTKEQEINLIKLKKIKGFKPSLIFGVTGSGKTEIYNELINEKLNKNKQILYLVPEISITSQMILRLQNRFGNRVIVYHSKYSNNERVEMWKLINENNKKAKIILGARSSILLPFRNLGLIIVDEEHDNSFKQFDPSPRYNARDLAVYMGYYLDIKVILGSATPSIESYYNVKQG